MIKNFSIFKNKDKKEDKHPDYKLSVNLGTKEQPDYVEIGGGWVKEYTGGKFISCKLNDAWETRKGFEIVEQKAPKEPVVPKFDRDSKGKPLGDDINPDDIPF